MPTGNRSRSDGTRLSRFVRKNVSHCLTTGNYDLNSVTSNVARRASLRHAATTLLPVLAGAGTAFAAYVVLNPDLLLQLFLWGFA